MTKEKGGPAFPALPIQRHTDTGEILYQSEGMTLRDYFAAKAMQALIDNDGLFSEIPTQAYALADAMLKAREV
jgi:hypothetical protein